MKKVLLVMLFALLAVGLATAQGFNYIPTTDTLGAHNDGGRGCAGCHAPHSGGRGSGGELVAGSGIISAGGVEGDAALWGTDVSLITQVTLSTGGGRYAVNFGGAQQYTSTSGPLVSGIALCLSCHDGNVSKGAMMMNQAYEQAVLTQGATGLPNGNGLGTYHGDLYGTTPIPTLLGNDGGTLGDYTNDHPLGPAANITAVAGSSAGANLGFSTGGTNTITWTVAGNYATFVSNYGMPAVLGMKVDAVNQVPYVVCTTCHNQHIMNVYKIGASAPIAGVTTGTVATYFFINAPYNPGAAWTPTAAPSTTQFCRECHFSHANEYYGVNTVTTAF